MHAMHVGGCRCWPPWPSPAQPSPAQPSSPSLFRRSHLEQEVEVRHAGEHFKEEDGEEGDEVVLGGDDLVGHKLVARGALLRGVDVDDAGLTLLLSLSLLQAGKGEGGRGQQGGRDGAGKQVR